MRIAYDRTICSEEREEVIMKKLFTFQGLL